MFCFRFSSFHPRYIRGNMNNNSLPDQPNYGMKALNKLLPIAIAITLTNGLVFVMFYRRRSLRTSSNYLLLGLAVCDFLTGVIIIPYFIIFCFDVVPLTISKDFSYWMYILHTLMAVAAAYHILIITAEKYLAITRPLKHYLVTKATVFKVLAGIWITSTFIAVIPLVWKSSQSRLLYLIIHSSVCLVLVFVIPYVFMIYAYIVMFKAITSKRRPSSSTHRDTRSKLQKKIINDRKCILVFAMMAVIFAVCWLPYFTIALTLNIKRYLKLDMSEPILKAVEVFAFVRYITSVTNPLLYTFFKRDFWQALRNLPLRKSQCSYRSSSSNIRRRPMAYRFTVKNRARSIDSSTMLSRLSWVGESPTIANTMHINWPKEQTVFISSV